MRTKRAVCTGKVCVSTPPLPTTGPRTVFHVLPSDDTSIVYWADDAFSQRMITWSKLFGVPKSTMRSTGSCFCTEPQRVVKSPSMAAPGLRSARSVPYDDDAVAPRAMFTPPLPSPGVPGLGGLPPPLSLPPPLFGCVTGPAHVGGSIPAVELSTVNSTLLLAVVRPCALTTFTR